MTYSGIERRKNLGRRRQDLHRTRWLLLLIWIIIFTLSTVFEWRDLRHTINDLKKTKASVISLERTDCGLVSFLKTARKARLTTSKTETGFKKAADLKAARGYQILISKFGDCK